ncbi:DNA polymerase III subunit gamma/tau [Acinetobacter sp. ANC 4169]|uniref:DNA polymerase III subunit gamma/tau n=1 Tax=Acinetobacter sp. ANC 4169 TaxID=1977879 RepID=UPI000A336C04|nr:DNA polymerase III subunit gamma/tau [Acinetobacter sp. ANC 4169]OTG71338.1 DNA polymerase III subunit gamma/tau [Acinetobacter sp. ANC 4169]
MYQVLARKYRPRNFNELVGQNHVSRALTSALERGRLHHAYLFTGTRGVGKTTIARILAKCLNCETGVTSTPCEVCATCKAVNEGRFIDLIEIDAASRTKVEDTRELLDNVPYAPTQGRFKVYLIDEVHMLSTHSFNALLKTLEEPPEHVKFLFATTDPQKLPITVISRCLQFTLRPLAVDEITEHLGNILKQEQIQAEQDAIWQIAESAQGSLRDALSLTDQAIAYGQGEIQHQDVKDMLGLIDRTIIYDLILAIHQNQKARVSELLMQFRQQALDVSLVLDQLISTLHELALLQYLPELSLKYSAEINQKIMQLSQRISAQDLQLYYQVACKGRADLQLAVTQEQGFEMCVLRLLAFRPLQPNEIPVSQTPVVTQNVHPVVQQAVDSEMLHQQSSQKVAVEPITSVESAPVYDDFDDGQYDDDPFNEVATQSVSLDEPSSDDFLDAELEQQAEFTEPAQQNTVETPAINPAAASDSDQIVFDPAAADVLFGMDDEIAVEPVVEASSDDFLFDEIAPLPTDESSSIESQVEVQVQVQQPVEDAAQDSLFDLAPEPAVPAPQDVQGNLTDTSSKLMPQDILQLKPQVLEGEWTVDKWEYWFRNSELSPAVQELAQQGVMTGQINGESIFQIPKQYEALLTQLQHALEQALKTEWPGTHFQVHYAEVATTTPYSMQTERKEKAYARAAELLHAEPAVKELLQNFEGEIQNIQLK